MNISADKNVQNAERGIGDKDIFAFLGVDLIESAGVDSDIFDRFGVNTRKNNRSLRGVVYVTVFDADISANTNAALGLNVNTGHRHCPGNVVDFAICNDHIFRAADRNTLTVAIVDHTV